MSVRPHQKQQSDPEYADVWLIDWYDEYGKRHKYQYRGREIDARQLEQSWRIRTKRMPASAHPSLAEAAPAYIDHYRIDHLPDGVKWVIRKFKILLAHVGRYHFPSITGAVVEDYKRARLADGVKPTTIQQELAILSGFCRWAHEQGWCERLYIKRFPAKMAKSAIPNVPGRTEVVRFLRAIPRHKRGIWAAMYYCGLRSSEARGLTPAMINWPLGILLITGKGGKQRIVPIHRKLRPYLRHLPFYAAKDLRGVAKWAMRRANLSLHIHPHLMRHAFGVHATERGVSLRALQDIMGHSTSQVTEIYSRLAAEALSREMRKL